MKNNVETDQDMDDDAYYRVDSSREETVASKD